MNTIDVTVHLPSLLERSVDGARRVTVQATTLQGAIDALMQRFPKLKPLLFQADGELREHVLIFYNDENIRWLDSLDVPLRQGDSLTVLQAVSGG